MKIVDVRINLLEKKLTSTMRISRGGFTLRRHAIVEVVTDEGIIGYGEAVGDASRITKLLSTEIKSIISGKDPLNINIIFATLNNMNVYLENMGSFMSLVSGIEMACQHIKSQFYELQPSYLIGGKIKEQIEAYASDIYWEKSPEIMAENALRIIGLGYKNIKIHIGVESPAKEYHRIKKIRDAIGEDIKLMIDLNAGYSLSETLEAIKIWDEFNIFWIEEPFLPIQKSNLIRLRKHNSVMVALGENIVGLENFHNYLSNSSMDILMPDLGRVGGINETVKIFHLAETFGLQVSPHNYSSGLLTYFSMQVMSAFHNSFMLEIDTSNNAVYDEFLTNPIKVHDGSIKIDEIKLNDDIKEVIRFYRIN